MSPRVKFNKMSQHAQSLATREKTINTASVSTHIDLKNRVSDFWHMRLPFFLFFFLQEDKVRKRKKNRTSREKKDITF